jgi:hypothetical protein
LQFSLQASSPETFGYSLIHLSLLKLKVPFYPHTTPSGGVKDAKAKLPHFRLRFKLWLFSGQIKFSSKNSLESWVSLRAILDTVVMARNIPTLIKGKGCQLLLY